MATWRCPHCATLQVESPRCFVCKRSATSCATCVNFRRSLVGGLGYCALDRRREPLTGEEQRACWSQAVATAGEGLFDSPAPGQPEQAPTGRVLERPRGDRLIEVKPPLVSGT